MLYQIGTLTLDTMPFAAEEMGRRATSDFAVKPLVGRLPGREFMGEGEDSISITGQLLPSKIGGLTELETAHTLRRSGQALPLMRGDGKAYGWFVIDEIREEHRGLDRQGVGFAVKHTISLTKVEPPAAAAAGNIVGTLLSLFGVLAR